MEITRSWTKWHHEIIWFRESYRIFSLLSDPNSGERGPVKSLLKDKSLQLNNCQCSLAPNMPWKIVYPFL